MTREVRILITNNIYDQLQEEANKRGLKVNELVKWIIGDYVKYANPPAIRMPVSSVQPMADKLSRMANLMVNQMSSQGMFKCPVCTLTLTSEDLEKGECSNCGSKI